MDKVLSSKKQLLQIFLFGLLTIAFFLRFWNIDTLPSGLYPDEAVNGIDAVHAIENNDFRLFYSNNSGREGLFINLQALTLLVFGIHIWSLKLFSAIFGTLTVFGVYLVARELWQRQSIALVSAFFTAFSYWAINFSRIGFRANMVPFLLVFSFFFLLRGLRTQKNSLFFWSGITFGLGLHTYIAFRVAPLILVIFLLGALLSYKDFLKRFWKGMLIFILGAFITALPMFIDFAQNPEHFTSRSNEISIFAPSINHGHFWLTLGETFGLSLLKYNFWGDQNWRHNYPPYPNLDPFTGTLFLIGFIFLISRTITLLGRRWRHHEYNPELAQNFLFLGWFFAMLVPEFLTNEGLPHSLRSIGTIPVVMLIASLPLLWLHEWYLLARPVARFAFVGICAFSLCLIAGWNSVKYFYFFANNPNQHGSFNQNFTNMAEYLNHLPGDVHKYVYANAGGTMINNNLPVTAQPIVFLTHRQLIPFWNHTMQKPTASEITFFTPENAPATSILAPAVVIPMNYDDGFIEKLRETYPDLEIRKIDPFPGMQSDFTSIIIK